MTEAQLYERCDEILGPYLGSLGFEKAKPGEYLRRSKNGEDRILVSRGSRSRAKTHFLVAMSYYPHYLETVREMFKEMGEDRGFPCGPYLSPVGVTQREKYWSYKTVEALSQSLQHVLRCLQDVGLPWLESLRDPKVFSENVDPVAALDAGIAHEVAGNMEKAAAFYREVLRRMQEVIRSGLDEEYLLRRIARPFIFVSIKLGVEKEKREEFQRKLNYFANVDAPPTDCGNP